jgi:hypothetical protein
VYKASLNGSREKMKEYSSRQLKSKALFNHDVSPQHVQQVLPALLDTHTSMALMTMSRIPEEHQVKNHTFRTALQRKLRLPILNNTSDYKYASEVQLSIHMETIAWLQSQPQNQVKQRHP